MCPPCCYKRVMMPTSHCYHRFSSASDLCSKSEREAENLNASNTRCYEEIEMDDVDHSRKTHLFPKSKSCQGLESAAVIFITSEIQELPGQKVESTMPAPSAP